MSETAKHRDRVLPFCSGNGIDLGSAGDPVVPWAIQVDLPTDRYRNYNLSRPEACIHWRGSAIDLPFKDGVLSFVHASHLLEDFADWAPVLKEWDRVLKPGGFMLIAVPDHERFRAYVRRGAEKGIDCDNKSHRHESRVGELREVLTPMGYVVLFDELVSKNPEEYSIICAAAKLEK